MSPAELVRARWGSQYADEMIYTRRYVWHLRRKIEPDAEHFATSTMNAVTAT